ncbi:MAG: HD domain-containing protein [Treponema sp.]|nr:HD domain-containing protein [Treponema sp.]
MRHDVRSALLEGYTEPIRDMLWGHIYLTPALAALTESPPFMRLHRILQLGPAFRVYPGATHTRASHSIGVYHLARRLLSHLAEQGADAWLSPEGVKSFLCAALLHDLGHFPYTHSLKELPLEEHEALTGRLILSDPVKGLVAAAGGNPDLTAAIVDTGAKGEGSELFFYRRLLSGALDPDKLDYLSRDGRCCGVPYGAQDVDFILSRLHPHPERGVDIDSRGILAVESLLFSKYLMYRSVYWHRQVRSATAMVKKALLGGLESGAVSAGELYNLDDQGLFALAARRAHPLFHLVESVRNGRLFAVAAEIPFDGNAHGTLLDLTERPRLEESLAAELSPLFGKTLGAGELIIDLPEPVSFESGLFITDERCFFAAGSTVFRGGPLDAFVKALRTIRVFIDPRYEEYLQNCPDGILHTTEKWVKLYKGS